MLSARLCVAVLALGLAGACPAAAADYTAPPAHGIAMHGDMKYGPGFTHFDYAYPDAPKGGTITSEATGPWTHTVRSASGSMFGDTSIAVTETERAAGAFVNRRSAPPAAQQSTAACTALARRA